MRIVRAAAALGAIGAALAMPAAASAYTVYVTNEKDNTVSVIDSEKLEVVKTVKVGQRPRGIILSKDGKWLIVCASDDNIVQVYDAKTLEFVKTLPSGPDPELLILHPSGNPLYIANEDDNLVTVVDIKTGKVVGRHPRRRRARGHGHEPRRQGAGQHVGNDEHGPFHRHDDAQDVRQRAGRQPPARRHVQPRRHAALGQLRDRRHRDGDRPEDRKIIGKVALRDPGRQRKEAIQPVGIRITKDGKMAFVALGPANRVAVIDTATFKVREIPPRRPARLADGLHAGRQAVVHDQRRLQRRVGHRR